MSLFLKLSPIVQRILNKSKSVTSSKFLANTNTIIGIIVGLVTLVLSGNEIIKNSESEETVEIKTTTDEKQKDSIIAVTEKKVNILDTNHSKKSLSKNGAKLKKEVLVYFNTKETLTNSESLALFIVNENHQISADFQRSLNNNLLINDINTSSSLFNTASIRYYNNFYSANQGWLETIGLKKYTNSYLIGMVREIVTISSFDHAISIVTLSFEGRLVSLDSNEKIPIRKEVKESNYVKSTALNDAYKNLSEEIANML